MDPNKLPEGPQENPAEPRESAGELPLAARKVGVARFNRRALCALLAVFSAVTAISFVTALSPKKKLSAQEISVEQEKSAAKAKPPLPENFAGAPDKYSDLPRPETAVAPSRGATSFAADSAAAGRGSGDQQGGAGYPGRMAGPQQSRQLSPEEQSRQAREDQRRKDSVNASRAGVTFEGGGKTPEPIAKAVAIGAPDFSGLVKVADRLGQPQTAAEEDQNLQGEKRGFAREKRDDFPYLKATLLAPISPYEIKAGSILPGVLITGISSDLPGQITAQASENVYDTATGRFLLIPQGARFNGEYDSKIAYGQERVLIVWSRIIMPNGNSVNLEGMPGTDLSGYAGVTGAVNNHYGKLITGVILGSVIGAGAQAAVGGQGSANVPPAFPQLFVSGAAANINQAGQQITQKNLNLQPTIEVPPGQKINIFVTKDMVLKPYLE